MNSKILGPLLLILLVKTTCFAQYDFDKTVSISGNLQVGTTTSENSEGWTKYLNIFGREDSKILTSTSNIISGIWSHNYGFYNAPIGGIIGTFTPHPFSIITNKTAKATFDINGNLGIGTINPKSKLEIFNEASSGHLLLSANDNPSADETRIDIDFQISNTGHTVGRIASFYQNSCGSGYGGLRFYTRNAGFLIEKLRIAPNGNVLIGKTSQANPNYKLDVAGKVRADEITVNTSGADFVFEKEYNLRPLHEVEAFIKENRHLPDIAPAKTMQENGVSVGEMNAKLLQKVEELTLYIINQNRLNDEQNMKIQLLEEKLSKLSSKK